MSQSPVPFPAIAPGQVWRHVGFDGVPATGLRVRVVRRDDRRYEAGWACEYPDRPGPYVWYPLGPWRGWAPEVPDRAARIGSPSGKERP